jgi:hypothetical protein
VYIYIAISYLQKANYWAKQNALWVRKNQRNLIKTSNQRCEDTAAQLLLGYITGRSKSLDLKEIAADVNNICVFVI